VTFQTPQIGITSPITKVRWAGWESNTHQLQRTGWQISAEQESHKHSIRFAFKHPNFRIYGISQSVDLAMYWDNTFHHKNPFATLPVIDINYMASRMEVVLYDDLTKFEPIDATPSFNTMERKNIEDFMIFRPIGNAKEIIIAEPEVSGLLDMILKKQDPKQEEIREKKRKEWRRFISKINEEGMRIDYEKIEDNRNNIVAQLITV